MENYGGYLGILKWSLAQSDGTKPSDVKPMSEEDRAFFEKAVEEACVSDATRMKRTLEELEKEGMGEEETCNLLNVLEELLESLDNARDFQNLNGYQKIIDLLNSSTSNEVKQTCCSLLGTAAQNQPVVQKVLVESNVIPQLMEFVRSTTDMKLKAKALRSVSSIITGCEDAEKVFLLHNGLNLIKDIIKSDENSLSVKQRALYLLLNLSYRQVMLLRQFLSKDLIILLAQKYLVSDDIDLKETSLRLVDFVLSLDRKSFEIDEVREPLKEAFPSLNSYCSLSDTPDEIKNLVKHIEEIVA